MWKIFEQRFLPDGTSQFFCRHIYCVNNLHVFLVLVRKIACLKRFSNTLRLYLFFERKKSLIVVGVNCLKKKEKKGKDTCLFFFFVEWLTTFRFSEHYVSTTKNLTERVKSVQYWGSWGITKTRSDSLSVLLIFRLKMFCPTLLIQACYFLKKCKSAI